jgi:signal peptidase I
MPYATNPSKKTRFRSSIEAGVMLLLFVLICQTWLVDGFLRRYAISGPSMATTLLGEHRDLVCGRCGIAFFCDSSFQPLAARAVCPNCGFAENDLASADELGGDRVLVDRSAFQFRKPRRWEVIAFRSPRLGEDIVVKRVIGLPGEIVEIRHGDVYINGRIARKPFETQLATAIAVDNANFVAPELTPRWQPEKTENSWKISSENGTTGNRVFRCDKRSSEEIDWLVYRHSRRAAAAKDQTETTPVEDTLAYNQNRTRRVEDVHPMCDLLLDFTLAKIDGNGNFFIRATDGREQFQLAWNADKKAFELLRDGLPLDLEEHQVELKNGTRVTVSLFDRQFWVAVDKQPILCVPLVDQSPDLPSTAEPFALGTLNMEIAVQDVRVCRDLYYTEPIGREPYGWGGSLVVLGEDNYYVLGDNSSISEDSRTWGPRLPVHANSLLGKPLAVIYPPRMKAIFGVRFQIPDFARIRYIR